MTVSRIPTWRLPTLRGKIYLSQIWPEYAIGRTESIFGFQLYSYIQVFLLYTVADRAGLVDNDKTGVVIITLQ